MFAQFLYTCMHARAQQYTGILEHAELGAIYCMRSGAISSFINMNITS